MVVLPVRGGATMRPRVPLPMGVTISMIFAQEILLDGVRRNEDVRGLGGKMMFGRAKESESFFGDFKIA
jgi:hypothetical protein